MLGLRYWVNRGTLQAEGQGALGSRSEADAMAHDGAVRLTTGPLGTEVKWHVCSPCYASLCTVMHWLPQARGPFVLRFQANGWFEEVLPSVSAAVRRIEHILARGDRHFTSRIFTMEQDPLRATMPDLLRETLREQSPPQDYAVECAFDTRSRQFVVKHVGSKSAIGRVWGPYTSSFPCQTEGTYGDSVSAAYEDVIKHGRPRYDHVLAALRLPDNDVHWVPYHRLILPHASADQASAVSVVSQIAQVDISVL